MTYKPAKPHYVCDRCGVEAEAAGTPSAPYRPEGWQHVHVTICEDGVPEDKRLDVCPICAALYIDLAAEMGFRFLHTVCGTGVGLSSVDLSACSLDDDMCVGFTD